MAESSIHVVTGAFGYLGRYIARRLLDQGKSVITLTGHPQRPNPFEGRIEAYPFLFDNPKALIARLTGAAVVYNTYWVRFIYGLASYDLAVDHTQTLIRCAKAAGVKRFVHIGISKSSLDSHLPYFRGKAILEKNLIESGLSYAIVRPTVLFGKEDILINNIAWLLRKFPVFGMFGKGDYRIQPVFVDDVAALAVDLGDKDENLIYEAAGPEIFTFAELVRLIRKSIGRHSLVLAAPSRLGLMVAGLLQPLLKDVLVTPDEIDGLMGGLLVTDQPSICPTRFSDWLSQHHDELGRVYASELARHFR